MRSAINEILVAEFNMDRFLEPYSRFQKHEHGVL